MSIRKARATNKANVPTKIIRRPRARFGYTLQQAAGCAFSRNIWAVEERQAIVIRRVFSLAALIYNGKAIGFRKIADILNSEGFRSCRGITFTAGIVQSILATDVYTGMPASSTNLSFPAIVSADEALAARQARAASPRTNRIKNSDSDAPDLLGKLICSGCARPLSYRRGQYASFRCPAHTARPKDGCKVTGISEAKLLKRIDFAWSKKNPEGQLLDSDLGSVLDLILCIKADKHSIEIVWD